MTSRIVAIQAPTHFVDEQIRGPFGSFRHEHRFVSMGEATEMIDTIEFTVATSGRNPTLDVGAVHVW